MRVNSGKFKGKKLIENKYDHIKPATDIYLLMFMMKRSMGI